ncbi:hypothetical protein OGAPHI_005689 [Ogataea philodendri]|uniref:Uncharacterized protein n=1 Tax=Ogataea philodendri TaxID=1378263 RepID=A0A9P8NZM4_9ASCO|nr:uncharacterized protein OGAPHI_005689 [Ogataea philodendri]KAH3662437.1 hypothetical protein OGAPHI_005689 [Ogataea philodendri]
MIVFAASLASRTDSLGPDKYNADDLESSSGRSTSTSKGSCCFNSKLTNRFRVSLTGTFTVRFWVCSLTMAMIFCWACLQLSKSPSITTVLKFPKMSSSSDDSLLPVRAMSIFTPVDSKIGFKVLPCDPITVDISLNGMPNSILTGFMILNISFLETGSCSAASTMNVNWVVDDLTAGLKDDWVIGPDLRPFDRKGPHFPGVAPTDTPKAGKNVSSSMEIFFMAPLGAESSSVSNSCVEGSDGADDGAEDSVAETMGVSGSSENALCFCASNSAGVGIVAENVIFRNKLRDLYEALVR